jgi:hypothetical protein
MVVDVTPCWRFEDFAHLVPSHGFLRDYFNYALQCTDAPPQYHIIACAALIANAISAEHQISISGETIPLHDYFLISGKSGSRKSAAIKRMVRMAKPCYMQQRLDSRLWFPESCTPEGIMMAMQKDPNRMMILTEWSDLQAQAKAQYWAHTPQFFEMVFDQMPIQRLKMKEEIKIERPSLTILGASTPSLIKQHTTLNDWEAGKLARYIICPATKPVEMEMANAVEHIELLGPLRDRFAQILAPASAIDFVPTREAKAIKDAWQYSEDWRTFANKELPPHLRPSAERAGDHVWRLATIYQASIDFPHSYAVTADAIIPAIQMVWTCLLETANHFGVLPMHDKLPLVRARSILALAGAEGIEKRMLMRRLGVYSQDFNKVIGTLRECGELTERKAMGSIFYGYIQPAEE